MKTIKIGKITEKVIERRDFPTAKMKKVLKGETVAVLGYGVQGRSQALNMRDNGLSIIVGEDFKPSWVRAVKEGWKPGKNLFSVEEAARRGTIKLFLLSDAGQKEYWPRVRASLRPGHALYFSHGFSIVFGDKTGVVPPPWVDVIMVAPKGSGTTVRRLFEQGRGINASYAVHQDPSGKALDRTLAIGIAIGSGHLFKTTFEKEVLSDLTGERGVLMGAIYGIWMAQYNLLRKKGHSPLEAFNETVEEATQSLYPLIGENGMDWMYANCSTTAQRGALDWAPRFRDAVKPVFDRLYHSVATGRETDIVLKKGANPNYRKELTKELEAIRKSEMWQAGAIARALRPERLAVSGKGRRR